jgi:hypothetical protein
LLSSDKDEAELETHMSTTITGPRHDRPATTATPRAPSQLPGSGWNASFDQALAAELRQRATRRRIAFWLLVFVFAAAMLGTTLPTPLYVIYQAQWHFSAALVTVIAVLAFSALLATLCLFSLARIATSLASDTAVSQ